MKTIFFLFVFFSGVAHQVADAQGTTFLSNLSEEPLGNSAIGRDFWYAASFRTGLDPAGYNLSSIQLRMAAPSGNPSGFDLLISQTLAGSSIGDLSGPEPAAAGVFSFAASGVHLLPSSFYFIIASASSGLADGSYNWSYANAFTQQTGWDIVSARYQSTNGLNWSIEQRLSNFQFSITATTVPEPSSLALLGLGGSLLWSRLARKSRPKR